MIKDTFVFRPILIDCIYLISICKNHFQRIQSVPIQGLNNEFFRDFPTGFRLIIGFEGFKMDDYLRKRSS